MKKVATLSINLTAGVAEFFDKINGSNVAVKQFGGSADKAASSVKRLGAAVDTMSHGTVTGVQAASSSIRLLEGGLNNNLRAVERFTVNVLGLGPILQKAFPLIGGLAFAGLLYDLGNHVYEFFKKLENIPERLNAAFRELQAPLQITNDQLRVSNARLDNEIAKLEGKRQNTLKLALEEATLAADKLGDALDRDIKALNKFLEENKTSIGDRIFTGEPSDKGVREFFGGKEGKGGFEAEVADIKEIGREKIAAAAASGNETKSKQARADLDESLRRKYEEGIAFVNQEIEAAKKRALPTTRSELVGAPGFTGGQVRTKVTVPGENNNNFQARLAYARKTLEAQKAMVALQSEETTKTAEAEKLKGDRSNERGELPLAKKLADLKAQIAEANTKLGAAGGSEAAREIAAGAALAIKSIQQVNDTLLKRPGEPKVSKQGEDDIKAYTAKLTAIEAEVKWQEKLRQTTDQIQNQVRAQELLTSAIGKGYEAQKRVGVAIATINKMGFERYNDPKLADDRQATEAGEAALIESERVKASSEATDTLEDQIKLERSLAQVQMQGAEAVRLLIFQDKLRELTEKGALPERIKAEKDLYAAQRQNISSADLAKINERLAAVQKLTAAQMQGAEAVRRAGLESKYAQMALDKNVSPEVIKATRSEDEAQHQLKITEQVSARVLVFQKELDIIGEQYAKLEEIRKTEGDTLDLQRSRRALEDEQLRVLVQQSLAQRGAMDGVRAFFIQMREQAKSAADIVYESLNSAVDKVSDNLAKVMTGQKAAWKQMFQGLGEQFLKDQIKGTLQKGLADIGKHIPGIKIPGLGGQLGSSRANPIYTRDADGAGIGKAPVGLPVPSPGSGSSGGGILGSLGKIFGGSAGGGIFNFDETRGGPTNTQKSDVLMGKPDGTENNPYYVIPIGQSDAGAQKESGVGSLLKSIGGQLIGTGVTMGIGLGVGKLGTGGARASGGPVSPGMAYTVGERGQERFVPESAGTIISNQAMQRGEGGGGSNHYYTIDARGTDPVLTEMRVARAIKEAHGDSISKSVQVQADRSRRVPAHA